MKMAAEGWRYVVPLILLGAALAWLWPWAGGAFVALGLFCAFFFRDPERLVPQEPGLVVSPADGKVVQVLPAPAGNPTGAQATQVSIFLSIFDVHVNRAPITGRLTNVTYNKGEFLPAFDDKASLRNEQNSAVIEGEGEGARVAFTQIAGLIARRIVFTKKVGDTLRRGERVGLIRFGSRTDVFVPQGAEIRVKVGDRVQGGSSVIAAWPGGQG